MVNYLEGLNEAQSAAVENYQGATLVIAGAGSGKTRVLTMRIAYMLQQGIKSYNILALTFTNKAAREMKERIGKTLPPQASRGLWMGTFHSIFCRILRSEASLLGFPEAFTIYDSADSKNVIKALLREMELPEDTYKPNDVYSRISLSKNNLVLPEAYAANASLMEEDKNCKRPQLYQVYARYVQRCRQNGAMDFDDILLYMNILLRDFPQVAQKYGEQFQYILVDEYQDTNYSQYLIVKKLGQVYGNICVVGDDSQSIYSFRGARIENILRFQKDYPAAKVFKLEQNYRSTATIVNAANSVIEKNSRKLPKKLFSANEMGEKIRLFCTQSDKEEALRVATDIHTTIYTCQESPSDFAILYRTNAQSRVFEEYLRNKGIPYRIYGGQSFYQRAEIKDMIAYLRLAVNPRDDEALRRIINFPPRGIGDTSVSRVADAARAAGSSMWDVLLTQTPAEMGIRGGAVKSLGTFMATFADISQRAENMDAYALANEVAARSGILPHYRLSKTVEDESRLQNTEELLNAIKSFVENALNPEPEEQEDQEKEQGLVQSEVTPTIGVWLQDVSLLTDMDSDDQDETPRVTLLTVHASKGLEFKHTYIVGMEENLFPSQRGVESIENIEEERRLFYVALTRAEKRATLSFSTSRFKWGSIVNSNPSRFIREIDSRYMDMPPMFDFLSTSASEDDNDNSPTRSGWSSSRRGTAQPSGEGSKGTQSRLTKSENSPRSSNASATASLLNQPPSGFRKVASATPTPPAQGSGSLMTADQIEAGRRVRHERFGLGTIVSMEQTATDMRITVKFDMSGEKTLLQKYAKLTRA